MKLVLMAGVFSNALKIINVIQDDSCEIINYGKYVCATLVIAYRNSIT